MTLTLKSAATYLTAPRMPRAFLRVVESVRRIFTFTQERANRLARFVRIVNAYRGGKPIRDIESHYGCSRSTVLRYARLAGIDKRPKGFDPKVRGAVLALYRQGASIAQIQAQLGVSQAYVSKTATEEGINRRNFKRTLHK